MPRPGGSRTAVASGSSPPRRHLALDVAVDLRDVGGYRGCGGATVRWRTLYRSDSVCAPSGRDLERLVSLGLRTVVDLRTTRERASQPAWPLTPGSHHGPGPADGDVDRSTGTDAVIDAGTDAGIDAAVDAGIDCYHHPVRPETWADLGLAPGTDGTDAAERFLTEQAVAALDVGAGAIGSVLALLSDADGLPLLVHSTLGKDRTGVVVAVVLALLGVDDAVIAHDHGLSRHASTARVERMARGGPARRQELLALPAAHLDAPPSVVRHLLAEIRRRWGSIEAYADSLYVDERAVARIRANLLDPPGR